MIGLLGPGRLGADRLVAGLRGPAGRRRRLVDRFLPGVGERRPRRPAVHRPRRLRRDVRRRVPIDRILAGHREAARRRTVSGTGRVVLRGVRSRATVGRRVTIDGRLVGYREATGTVRGRVPVGWRLLGAAGTAVRRVAVDRRLVGHREAAVRRCVAVDGCLVGHREATGTVRGCVAVHRFLVWYREAGLLGRGVAVRGCLVGHREAAVRGCVAIHGLLVGHREAAGAGVARLRVLPAVRLLQRGGVGPGCRPVGARRRIARRFAVARRCGRRPRVRRQLVRVVAAQVGGGIRAVGRRRVRGLLRAGRGTAGPDRPVHRRRRWLVRLG
ncbi:hypothetical protein GCM10009635_14320 [Actinocatenispora thailandica]